MFRKTVSLLACALLLVSASCSSKAEGSSPAAVNAMCPINLEPVEPDGGRTEWNGQTIGFCCKSCIGKFDALDDAGKKAALEKAAATGAAGK